ncbi:YjbF family lipoprotein [Roseovarius sp. MMSF_3350]|uniref:YjbF family lipoprotein n=1 Tax=Roseovarius sp. MMSF_3350 TaxID=3046706 RepID=UPI00273F9ADA|nr:YjbF family lipoprotein [Roseovarius sp. MMSF_3350]
MRPSKTLLFAVGFLAALSLTGCTNTRQGVSLLTVGKTLIDSRRNQNQPRQQIADSVVQREVQRALQSGDGPFALMRIEETGSVAVLRVIETNGPYNTWAAWGTSERRSVSTRGGVITSTRGLGADLMSSSVNGLLGMLSRREDGIERQVLRHLDGENQIEETEAYCAFTPDGRQTYEGGALRLQVTRVDVFCKTDTGTFDNYYLVSDGGRIVEARTWLGEGLGYFTLSHLR